MTRKACLHDNSHTIYWPYAASQAFAVYRVLKPEDNTMSFFEFNWRLGFAHYPTDHVSRNEEAACTNKYPYYKDSESATSHCGCDNRLKWWVLMFLKNLPQASDPSKPPDVHCFFCNLREHELKTSYSCTVCGKGLHINCFSTYLIPCLSVHCS